MVLGDVSRTRRLSGNPLPTNVSDDDITTYLGYGTSMVKRRQARTSRLILHMLIIIVR